MSYRTISHVCFAIAVLALLTPGVTSAQEKKQPPYTVLPLKHVEAIDAAQSLEQLLDGSPEYRRIVPEPRTNALFVKGSKETVDTVEQFLKILDQQPETEPSQIRVYPLQNISADAAANVVVTLIDRGVRVSADRTTNSLVASGTKDQLAVLDAVLQKLDELSPPTSQKQVTAIELKHITPQKAHEVLNELHVEARVAADETHNRLLVSSKGAALDQLMKTIEKVDIPDRKTLNDPVQVRLVWLMEIVPGEEPKPPSSDSELERVSRSVEKRLGLSHLNSVAQLLVTVEPESSEKFTARGTAELNDGTFVDLEFEGALTGGSAQRPVMEFSVHATQRPEISKNGNSPQQQVIGAPRELASIISKVGIPAGHSVVLGVTSIRSTASVFILQILPANPDLQTTE